MISKSFNVWRISSKLCQPWLLYKHYSKRCPNISYAFGLYNSRLELSGVCSYARPMSNTLVSGAMQGDYNDKFLELNRLVVNEGLPTNTLSYFVSQTLKLLPTPCVIVSYADTAQCHHGYIYQATNWIYTGLSAKFTDYAVEGMENVHHASIEDSVGRYDKNPEINKSKLLAEKYGEKLYKKERARKHRYFYFVGSKRQKKDMRRGLNYPELPYPKGNNKQYDASYIPQIQHEMFGL